MKRHIGAMVAGLLVVLATVPGGAVGDTPAVPAGFNMLIEVPSPLGFEETLERLEVNAKAAGWKVPQKWKVDFPAKPGEGDRYGYRAQPGAQDVRTAGGGQAAGQG